MSALKNWAMPAVVVMSVVGAMVAALVAITPKPARVQKTMEIEVVGTRAHRS